MTQLVEQFEQAARELGHVAASADGQVRHGTTMWFGGDCEHFAQDWLGRHRLALVAIEAELLLVVASLRREVADQALASEATTTISMPLVGHQVGRAVQTLGLHESRSYAGGHLRITKQSEWQTKGPHNVRDLVDGLRYAEKGDQAHRAYDYPGGITVATEGAPPNRHVIVTVSGTETWTAGGHNPSDLVGNVTNLEGISGEKEAAIRQVLLASGITGQDKIMLIGHSQGGADVLAFAADSVGDKRYHVQSVVTVGAPPTPKYPMYGVDVLQLKGSHDVIPTLPSYDAASPSMHGVNVSDPWWTEPKHAHDPSTYATHLDESESQIKSFEQRQHAFFGGAERTGRRVLERADRRRARGGRHGVECRRRRCSGGSLNGPSVTGRSRFASPTERGVVSAAQLECSLGMSPWGRS